MATAVSHMKTPPLNGNHDKSAQPPAAPQPGLFSRMKNRIHSVRSHPNAGHGPIADRKLTSHDFRIVRTLGTGSRCPDLRCLHLNAGPCGHTPLAPYFLIVPCLLSFFSFPFFLSSLSSLTLLNSATNTRVPRRPTLRDLCSRLSSETGEPM